VADVRIFAGCRHQRRKAVEALAMSVAPVKSRICVVPDRPSIGYRSMNRSKSATQLAVGEAHLGAA
jgi:hypothetical protein